jgi:drug/metabolite transporter (DMT)-like permease
MTTAAGQVCASTMLLLPVMVLVDRPWTLAPPHAATWGAVLAVGLLSTALAYGLACIDGRLPRLLARRRAMNIAR